MRLASTLGLAACIYTLCPCAAVQDKEEPRASASFLDYAAHKQSLRHNQHYRHHRLHNHLQNAPIVTEPATYMYPTEAGRVVHSVGRGIDAAMGQAKQSAEDAHQVILDGTTDQDEDDDDSAAPASSETEAGNVEEDAGDPDDDLEVANSTLGEKPVQEQQQFHAGMGMEAVDAITGESTQVDQGDSHDDRYRMHRDTEQYNEFFLIDYSPPLHYIGTSIGGTIVSCVWLWIYFRFFYHSDRMKGFDGFKNVPQGTKGTNVEPDIVVAFKTPYVSPADRKMIPAQDLVMEKSRRGSLLINTGILCSEGAENFMAVNSPRLNDDKGYCEKVDRSYTKGDVKVSLLLDMYRFLVGSGFNTDIKTSPNHDEVYIAVSLESTVARDFFLVRDKIHIQLARDVLTNLGIKLKEGEKTSSATCSPPFIPYNPQLPQVLIENDIPLKKGDPVEALYHIKSGKIRAGHRIRIIVHELMSRYRLGLAKQKGLIADWYPCHNPMRLRQFQYCWGNWKRLVDLTFVQPIGEIRDYFGSRVAFRVAWNGTYCKSLLALVPISICLLINNILGRHGEFLAMTLVIIIWSRVTWNLWSREEAFFVEEFDVSTASHSQLVREEFEGKPVRSEIDGNQVVLESSHARDTFYRLLSFVVTFIFVFAVGYAIFCWSEELGAADGSNRRAALAMSIFMCVIGKIYQKVVSVLVLWENHKFNMDHYNSMVIKTVLFQFVNYYGTFFYIVIRLRHVPGGCASTEGNCMTLLRSQLALTVAIVLAFRILTFLVAEITVKAKLWWAGSSEENFLQKQCTYDKMMMADEIEDHVQLVLSLGYVLMFGGVYPLVAPLCFLAFAVQLRSVAVQLTTCTQRPVGELSVGIGDWHAILDILRRIGVGVQAFMLVNHGELFRGRPIITRISGFFLLSFAFYFLQRTIDVLIPQIDHDTKLLHDRRRHIITKIQYLSVPALKKKEKDMEARAKEVDEATCENIKNAAWEKLQQDTSTDKEEPAPSKKDKKDDPRKP